MSVTGLHARAVASFEAGATAEAVDLRRAAIADRLDPELVNDLAVMLAGSGDRAGARRLLEVLGTLAPGYADAAENLAALGDDPAGAIDHDPAPVADDRRGRFLQTVAEAQRTHLADNVDFLFEPWGRELPDPAGEGERLAAQLAVLDRCDVLWDALGDEQSRDLFLRLLAYRALGPAHVRLQLDPGEYRRSVIGMTAELVREPGVAGMPGMPYEWAHHVFDFTAIGLPVRLAGPPLPLASTIVFSQYAYRDEAAVPSARPQRGDVALDVGGCWGETAVWMAHHVGAGGHVHCFEPSPQNQQLLVANLERNLALAPQITVHTAPLAGEPGRRVWMDDITAAGATTHEGDGAPEGRATVPAVTDTVDALVARGELERVDFIKMDVEGAELEVLRGAAHTLRAQRPRLALAAYHRPDDLAVLPAFVASLGLRYRWYLQCSTMTDVDSILFGIPVEARAPGGAGWS
jgi:FkbM family methyltransferase